jgi:hypothetical protein
MLRRFFWMRRPTMPPPSETEDTPQEVQLPVLPEENPSAIKAVNDNNPTS